MQPASFFPISPCCISQHPLIAFSVSLVLCPSSLVQQATCDQGREGIPIEFGVFVTITLPFNKLFLFSTSSFPLCIEQATLSQMQGGLLMLVWGAEREKSSRPFLPKERDSCKPSTPSSCLAPHFNPIFTLGYQTKLFAEHGTTIYLASWLACCICDQQEGENWRKGAAEVGKRGRERPVFSAAASAPDFHSAHCQDVLLKKIALPTLEAFNRKMLCPKQRYWQAKKNERLCKHLNGILSFFLFFSFSKLYGWVLPSMLISL